jgi:hypothetical protein
MSRYRFANADGTAVIDSTDGCAIPLNDNYRADAYAEWTAAGGVTEPFGVPSFSDYVAAFTPGLQAWLESVALSNAYDSVLSCVSYKDSGVPQFAGDALAMIAWRDAVWRWASQWQAGFNGELPSPIPTLHEVIALAPQPEAFGWVVHTPGTIIESHTPVEQTS